MTPIPGQSDPRIPRGSIVQWLVAAIAMGLVAAGVIWVVSNRPPPPRYDELRVGTGIRKVLPREEPKLILEFEGEEYRRALPGAEFELQPGESIDPRIPAGPFTARIVVPLVLGEPSQGKIVVEHADCDVKISQAGRMLAESGDADRMETGVIMVPAGTIDLLYEIRSTGPAPRFRTGWALSGTEELAAITTPPTMQSGRPD